MGAIKTEVTSHEFREIKVTNKKSSNYDIFLKFSIISEFGDFEGWQHSEAFCEVSRIQGTLTLSACGDTDTDTMKSSLFYSFLHFKALFSHFLHYPL